MRRFILLLWLLLGIGYWYISKNHCISPKEKASKIIEATTPIVSEVTESKTIRKVKPQKYIPLRFKCSSAEPILLNDWDTFKDSILNTLEENKVIQIKGYSFNNEETSDRSFGMQRANAVAQLLGLADDKVRLAEDFNHETCTSNNDINLINFRTLISTNKIKEIDDRTIIYFLFNSTQKLNDNEVESYLDDVVLRVNKSGEKIRLTGHTDNSGTEEDNMRLGQARADVIKFYLLSKGLEEGNIISISNGENEPISSNETGEGRASNRRTELQILN